jgi:pimeloyl-ACP methyl ester carboxylesterase
MNPPGRRFAPSAWSFLGHRPRGLAARPGLDGTWRKKLVDITPYEFTREQLASVKNRVLVALGDNDFIRLEHALYAYATIPNAELAIIPDGTHFLLYDRPWEPEPIVAGFFAAPKSACLLAPSQPATTPARRDERAFGSRANEITGNELSKRL